MGLQGVVRGLRTTVVLVLGCWAAVGGAQRGKPFKYVRVGNAADAVVKTQEGFALMGGGTDLDEAFRWMCAHSGGGDFLILRSHGSDEYNGYVQGLCHENSVATLVIGSRAAAADAKVAEIIGKAEAIFIAGGDQAEYINFWKGTAVEDAVNAAIRRGVPVGGTSAGLAVQGEFIYSAQNDGEDEPNLSSKAALADPFQHQVVVVRGFLENPLLADTITDSHFVKRDRMGRLLVMMARVLEDGQVKELKGMGIDQETAVLVEADGEAKVVGKGAAYFLRASGKPARVEKGEALEFGPVSAVKVLAGGEFDVKGWTGDGAPYAYTVVGGVVKASRAGGIY
ncbi:MAG TPA: cyanophycinase [Acidobacteriaceae bacterium]|jgi:cyanophycinase|nr:cyanophycinase [Acidobacteriaceae bacterium]